MQILSCYKLKRKNAWLKKHLKTSGQEAKFSLGSQAIPIKLLVAGSLLFRLKNLFYLSNITMNVLFSQKRQTNVPKNFNFGWLTKTEFTNVLSLIQTFFSM